MSGEKWWCVLVVAVCLASCQTAFCDEQSFLDRPSLGIRTVAIADVENRLKELKIDPPTKIGVMVMFVQPYSPAEKAEFSLFDVILKVDRQLIRTADEFEEVMKKMQIGQEYRISGYTGKKTKDGIDWKRGTIRIKPVTERNVIFGQLEQSIDQISGAITYRHRDTEEYLNRRSEMSVSVRKAGGTISNPTLHIQHVAKDWLFMTRFDIRGGDTVLTIGPVNYSSVNRDNGSRGIWEWYRHVLDDAELQKLNRIVVADAVTLRCSGEQYRVDRQLTDHEQGQLKAVLIAHQALLADAANGDG